MKNRNFFSETILLTPSPTLPRYGLRPAGEGEYRFYPQTSDRFQGLARFCAVLLFFLFLDIGRLLCLFWVMV